MDNFYGKDLDYIHLKFGDMQKAYNFTDKFRAEYPNFCAEYELYWQGSEKCRFGTPLQIAQYVDMYDIPVRFYFNFTDTPVKDITEVYAYFIREYSGIPEDHEGNYRENYNQSLDGAERVNKAYKVVREDT